MDNLFDKEAETAILGSLLVDTSIYETVARVLTGAESFLTVDHQKIYNAISVVYEKKGTTDPIVVVDYLKRLGQLERVGGWEYIYELQAPIVETESAEHYAHIVEDYYDSRRFAKSLLENHQKLLTGEFTSNDEIVSNVYRHIENYQDKKSQRSGQHHWKDYDETKNADLPPTEWIIPDILPQGFSILAGEAKIGKSFFAWNLAIAAALGGKALGSIDVEKKRNVFYLSLEDSERLIHNRMKLMTPDDISPKGNFKIAYDFPKFNLIGLSELGKDIDKYNADLVIVDTWKHVSPDNNSRGSSYDIDYENMIPVQKLVNKKGISMLLITHTRKAKDPDNIANEIQGSTANQGVPETLLMVKKESDGLVLHTKGKHAGPQSFAMTFKDCLWQLEGIANDVHISSIQKDIQELLLESGKQGLCLKEISELTDKKVNQVSNTLRSMLKDGKISQPVARGRYIHNSFCKENEDAG